MTSPCTTPGGDFARAILEGIAHELHHQIQGIAPLVGEITDIYTAGGISQFDTFNQIQADIYNRPVVALEDNATAAGVWISTVVTLQHYRSYSQAHQQIARHQHTRRFLPQTDNVALYQAQTVKSRIVQEHIYS